MFKSVAVIGWVSIWKGLLDKVFISLLAAWTLTERRISVIGAPRTINNGASIPRKRWPYICIVKSECALFASGPATEMTAKNVPKPQHAVRQAGHGLYFLFEVTAQIRYMANANRKGSAIIA